LLDVSFKTSISCSRERVFSSSVPTRPTSIQLVEIKFFNNSLEEPAETIASLTPTQRPSKPSP
jgi:hypothetical protein